MKKCLSILFVFICGLISAQGVDTNFPEPNNQVYCVKYDSVHNYVYVGGYFTFFGGQARQRAAVMNATTGALSTWTMNCNNTVTDFYVSGNSLYITGDFTTVNGQARNHFAKFDITTQTLLAWNPSSLAMVGGRAMQMHNGWLYACISGATNYLCRIDTTTAAADPWQPAISGGGAYNSKLVGDIFYFGGAFNFVDGQPRDNIAAYDLSTATPSLSTWAPNADNRVNWIEYWNGNIYATGAFTAIAGAATSNFAEISDATGGVAVNTGLNIGASTEMFSTKVKGNVMYLFTYPGPLREMYLPTRTTTTWSVNFSSSVAHDMYGLDASASKVFIGGAWNISIQGVAKKIFGVVCANPYSPITGSIFVNNAPGNVCDGTTGSYFDVSTGSGATSYTWAAQPAGNVTSYSDSAHIDFPFSGVSQYTISVTGTNGCLSTNTATITVNGYVLSSSLASINFGNIICGDKDTLSINSNNYQGNGTVSYSWTGPSLNTTTGDTVVSSSQNTANYVVTSTSSEGCVGKDSIMLNVSPYTPSLNHSAQNILCSEKDSITITHDYPGVGTVTYTWTPTASLNLSNPNKPVAFPTTSTTYTLTSSSSDGCVAQGQVVAVNVTGLTINATAATNPVTCANPTNLNASSDYPGTGTVSYTWSPAGNLSNTNIANPVANPTASTTFQVDIGTPEGCLASGFVSVTVDPLQVTTTGLHTTTCGNLVFLNTSNNSSVGVSYSWSPATGLSSATASGPSALVSTTTVYTVTVSIPSSGCSSASAEDTVKVVPPNIPAICEVTSNDSSKNNVIYWDKTPYASTDSFIVYRETTTNIYTRIAAVAQTDSSFYVDTARSIGPANGNPNIGTYRYKMSVKDSCGNESAKSPYHNSVFFVDNQTGTFTWNTYAVENATTPVTQFNLMRDNANNGIWTLVGSVTGTQNTLNDPQYSTYQSIANWRVEALGFNCASTARYGNNSTQGAVVKSKSNITNNRAIGIKNNAASSFNVYPNPSNGNFVIELAGATEKARVKVISLIGEEIFSAEATGSIMIDLTNYASGTYLVQVAGDKGIVTKRIIKN